MAGSSCSRRGPERQLRCTRRVADVWPFSKAVPSSLPRRRPPAPPARPGSAARRGRHRRRACAPTPGSRSMIGRWRASPVSACSSGLRRGATVSTMKPSIYAQCGLRLRSEVELHLPLALGTTSTSTCAGDRHPTTRARRRRARSSPRTGRGRTAGTRPRRPDGFLLRFRECGEFVISADLSEVEVRPDPPGRPELLPILLAGTASAFVLTLRGETVLHAERGRHRRRGVAFVGQSGRGKSTLAALLCLDGAELVTDDVLAVDPGRRSRAPGGRELRLRAERRSSPKPSRTRAPSTADDRLALTFSRPPEPLPLAASWSPRRHTRRRTSRSGGLPRAVFWLLAFPRVHGWCRPE